jgi:starch-binding outer membrane protein, SusD/RagB family
VSDSFVEISPEYSIDSENYFNSESDYYDALVAAYDMLQSTYVNVILGEIASDNTLCGGENPTDVIGWQQIDDMIHTPVKQQPERRLELDVRRCSAHQLFH